MAQNKPSITEKSPVGTDNITRSVPAPWRLNTAVLCQKEANLHRAYALWLVGRGPAWIYQDDIIRIARQTGNSDRQIYRWLASGEGIFWVKGRSKSARITYSLIGMKRVLKHFGLSGKPGRMVSIPVTDLLGDLKPMRAALYASWVSKNSRWAARDTIEGVTGITPRTQLNYEKTAGMEAKKVFATWQWHDPETGNDYDHKQLPNIYYPIYQPYHDEHKHKRRNLETVGNNAQGFPLSGGAVNEGVTGRVLFDNPQAAKEKAYRLNLRGVDGLLFAKSGETRTGNVIVDPLPIALAQPAYSKQESMTQRGRK